MAPHAHATVTRLDAEPAMRMNQEWWRRWGRRMLRAKADSGSNKHDEPLFPREVLYHSQPVTWVLGETLEAARRGAARIVVEYEKLPAVLTIDAAIRAESFHSGPFRIRRGDAREAIATSSYRVSGELRIGGQEHFYLETQCAIARLDSSGGVAVECSTQHPSETQEVVARVLGYWSSGATG